MAFLPSKLFQMFHAETSFRIPAASSSLAHPILNPNYDDRVDAAIRNWCMEFLNVEPGSEKARYIQESKLGLLAAYAYPHLPYEKIVPVAKFIAWFFIADDILDSLEMSSSDQKKTVGSVYKLIFKGEHGKAAEMVQNRELQRQAKMFAEMMDELSLHMDESINRFKAAMIDVLDMFAVEASWVDDMVIPNAATYMWLREISAGVKPCFIIADCLQRPRMEQRHLNHPLVRRIEKIGLHHVAFSNDIISFAKEWEGGKYLNIVPILAHEYDISLNEAIEKVVGMIEDLEKEFQEIKGSILSEKDGLSMNEGVVEYLNGIEAWMNGNEEWGWLTARYHGLGWVAPPEHSKSFTITY